MCIFDVKLEWRLTRLFTFSNAVSTRHVSSFVLHSHLKRSRYGISASPVPFERIIRHESNGCRQIILASRVQREDIFVPGLIRFRATQIGAIRIRNLPVRTVRCKEGCAYFRQEVDYMIIKREIRCAKFGRRHRSFKRSIISGLSRCSRHRRTRNHIKGWLREIVCAERFLSVLQRIRRRNFPSAHYCNLWESYGLSIETKANDIKGRLSATLLIFASN